MPEGKPVRVIKRTIETIEEFIHPQTSAGETKENHASQPEVTPESSTNRPSILWLLGIAASVISALIAVTEFLQHKREEDLKLHINQYQEKQLRRKLIRYYGKHHDYRRSRKVHDTRFSHDLR